MTPESVQDLIRDVQANAEHIGPRADRLIMALTILREAMRVKYSPVICKEQ